MTDLPQPLLVSFSQIRLDQHDRWGRGERVLVESYLSEYPELLSDPDVLVELVACEFRLRRDRGESVVAEEYIQRFPQLAVELPSRLNAPGDASGGGLSNDASARSTMIGGMPSTDAETADGIGPDVVRERRSTTSAALVGRRFSDYEILEELARGGMGVVYKARQISLNRIVALKMILAGQMASEQEIKRFQSEAEAAATLDHPNIVPIFEVGEHEGRHFFAMGYVDGSSLATMLREGPWESRKAASLLRQIAETVQYAHARGIVHRDLKPQNVLLASDGQPRLTDFGLAKRLESGSDLTATGQILGTPGYMPPEQARGKAREVGPLSDVYSLGGILYALLVGSAPFVGDDPIEILHAVINRKPAFPRAIDPRISRDLDTITLKCLEKEPANRYSSAHELADDLDRFLKNEPINARPVGAIESTWRWCRRKPAVASLVAAVVLSLVAGTGVSTWLAIEANQQATLAKSLAARADTETKRANAKAAEALSALGQAATEQKRAVAALSVSERQLYASQIAAAQHAWELNNSHAAWDHLKSSQRSLRGWEYDYLDTLFTKSFATFRGPPGIVWSVAFSPEAQPRPALS